MYSFFYVELSTLVMPRMFILLHVRRYNIWKLHEGSDKTVESINRYIPTKLLHMFDTCIETYPVVSHMIYNTLCTVDMKKNDYDFSLLTNNGSKLLP